MTSGGVENLYMYLSTAWPLVIRPGAEPEWKRAKMRELYRTYEHYEDAEVIAAFQKWTNEQEKFPATKNIINELKWLRLQKLGKKADLKKTYQMEWIRDDGTEVLIQYDNKINYTWDEFMNVPRNKDHLDPEEWERRYKLRRASVLRKCREAMQREKAENSVL